MADHNGGPNQEGVVYINQEEGLKRVMHNTSLYVKLLNKFKVESKLDELLLAAEAGEYEKAQILAHTLKGTSANLSLIELFKQSQDLEARIKSKALNPESLQRIKACFEDTLTAIDTVIQHYG